MRCQLLKPVCPRAPALQLESSLDLLPLEKSPHSNKDPAQPKNIIEMSKYIYIFKRLREKKIFKKEELINIAILQKGQLRYRHKRLKFSVRKSLVML